MDSLEISESRILVGISNLEQSSSYRDMIRIKQSGCLDK